ncbi:MAG: hypothetical protein JO033_19585 [Acidobacteriaceae bacterium]|nr:hypothetical protein [Acidobacteriaceae bacterium]MBV9499135.1 hypothetical protein [Acidobacteriaceae bacterium]
MYLPFFVLPYQRSPARWYTFVSVLTQTMPLPAGGGVRAAEVELLLWSVAGDGEVAAAPGPGGAAVVSVCAAVAVFLLLFFEEVGCEVSADAVVAVVVVAAVAVSVAAFLLRFFFVDFEAVSVAVEPVSCAFSGQMPAGLDASTTENSARQSHVRNPILPRTFVNTVVPSL